MQLLLIAALLLLGGNNLHGVLEEVKPVLKEAGADELCGALDEAEKLSAVLSAVIGAGGKTFDISDDAPPQTMGGGAANSSATLLPIADIAEGETLYCISKYIAS